MISHEALDRIDVAALVKLIKEVEARHRDCKRCYKTCQRNYSMMNPDEQEKLRKHDREAYINATCGGPDTYYLTTLYSLRAHLRKKLHMTTFEGREWNLELQEKLIEYLIDDSYERCYFKALPVKSEKLAMVAVDPDSRVQKIRTKSLLRDLFEAVKTVFS